ncbi:MAG: hypothetical protein K0U98_11125 [Deltaproteobacteria bacterium]|nr:hypothetical protein [Deltaproteobacteria bacterium]
MKRNQLLELFGKIFEESSTEDFDWATVKETTTIEELGFDSLSVLDLLFDLEEALELQIAAKDMLQIGTVGEMLDYLENRLATS